jgi:putative ABC transport system ATP-binding protein
MLKVEEVSVTYGTGRAATRALDRVSLLFSGGELALVMGPSGSGKTSLLSILGCLLRPESGRVIMLGRDVTELSEGQRGVLRQRHIGYVFQAFRLFRSLSALDNVRLTMEVAGRKGRRERDEAMRALDDVGLSGRAHLKPHQLSGGEKQRVAIARALINDATIILADEPTASLDAESGGHIAGMLRRVATEKNRLVVVVSHDPRLLQYSDRVITLQDGRLLEDRRNKTTTEHRS